MKNLCLQVYDLRKNVKFLKSLAAFSILVLIFSLYAVVMTFFWLKDEFGSIWALSFLIGYIFSAFVFQKLKPAEGINWTSEATFLLFQLFFVYVWLQDPYTPAWLAILYVFLTIAGKIYRALFLKGKQYAQSV